MALKITIPDTSWSSQLVSLSGKSYIFEISYNERSTRWYINVTLAGEEVINSLKAIENINMTGRYNLVKFDHGGLFCVRFKKTTDPVGRDNFGLGKDYELIYLTNSEITTLESGEELT